MDDIANWIIFLVACLVIGAVIGVLIDGLHFYNFIDMSSSAWSWRDNKVGITDRKEFAGSYVEYSPSEDSVLYFIYNDSKDPYDFKGATYGIIAKDGKMYQLNFLSVKNWDYGEGSYILNPSAELQVKCEAPHRKLASNIKGFRIWKSNAKDDVSMRFGYLPSPFWKNIYEEYIKPFSKK